MKHLITLTLVNGKVRKCATDDAERAELAWKAAERLTEAGDVASATWTRDGVIYCELES